MNASRTLLRLAALPAGALVALASFGACNNGSIPIGSDQQPIACQSDADCPSGDVCASTSLCALSCVADADCPANDICQAGACEAANACVPSPEVCDGIDNDCDGVVDNGATCPDGGSCVNGACVAPAMCASDADCPSGDTCQSGTCAACVPSPEVCDGIDNDCDGVVDNGATCPDGGSCVNGACVAPAMCASDADCGPGGYCCSGSCSTLLTDAANCGACGAACQAGHSCDEGVCSP